MTPFFAVVGWQSLVFANTLIPDSLRVGHGSHGHGHAVEHQEPENHYEEVVPESIPNAAAIESIDDGHTDHSH